MTFLAFRPFRRRKHRNDVIVTSYIKILKLKSKDITSKTLDAKFYASRIKNKRIRKGGKIRPLGSGVYLKVGTSAGGRNQPATQHADVLLPHLEFVFPHIFLSG